MISTVIAGSIAAVFALGVLGLGAAALFWGIRHTMAVQNAPAASLEGRLAAVELKVDGLPSLWEEERKRAKRSQDSARKAREDADSKLAAIAEYEQSAGDVRGGDEGGGEEVEMHHVLPRLGPPTEPGVDERVAAIAHLLR